jgi:type I restriction enzyme, S subunit
MNGGGGKKTLVPKLRFPEFREAEGWDLKPGDELFNAINNRSPLEALPILAITQEHGAIPRDQIDYHVSVTEQTIESYKVVEKGDFIISLRSFQGGIEYSNYRGICSPAYVILRRKGDGSDGYFRHLFKSARFIQQLTRNIEGLRDGKMISYKQFSEQRVPLPKPAEQQKIADCLSSLDELIAAQGRKVEALKAYKRGLMQQLFPRDGETLPRLRFPEFREAPEWKEVKAGTLFANRTERGDDSLPIYSVTMTDGLVKRASLDRRIDDLAEAAGNRKVCRYDIAYNMMRMWQGACGVASEDCMVSPAYVVLSPQSEVHSQFYGYLFKLPQMLRLFTSHSRGLTEDRLRLYYPDFSSIPLPQPDVKEQERIASFLMVLDARLITESGALTVLRSHKSGLMQQLFPSLEAT